MRYTRNYFVLLIYLRYAQNFLNCSKIISRNIAGLDGADGNVGKISPALIIQLWWGAYIIVAVCVLVSGR